MDINGPARTAVITGLAAGPLPAKFVSLMVGVLWPSGDDVWQSMRAKVEALVNQKIADDVYHRVQLALQGLKLVVNDYTTAVRDSRPDQIYVHYVAATDLFLSEQPTFQDPLYQLLLLPLFAQFANLHLALLRDGVVNGAQWGMTAQALLDAGANLTSTVAGYTQWARDGVDIGLQTTNTGWSPMNRYRRQMQLDVLDHAALWPAFDPSTGYVAEGLLPDSMIYSDVVGASGVAGMNDFFGFAQSALLPHDERPIRFISIWGSQSWVNSFQCTFDEEVGPRVGELTTGDTSAPHGWSGPINWPDKPVTKVTASTVEVGDYDQVFYPACVQLFAGDGAAISSLCGCGPITGAVSSSFEYPGRVLADIWVGANTRAPNEYSGYNASGASYLIFGFRFNATYADTP